MQIMVNTRVWMQMAKTTAFRGTEKQINKVVVLYINAIQLNVKLNETSTEAGLNCR